jgi:hypothetical protein
VAEAIGSFSAIFSSRLGSMDASLKPLLATSTVWTSSVASPMAR